MIYNQFEVTAKKYSENTAFYCNERNLSYKQSISIINQLTENFKLSNNQAALIYLDKSEFIPLFQLAINKSNNIFSCLDIKTPQNRLFNIIEQLKPKYVISETNFILDIPFISHEKIYINNFQFSLWILDDPNNYSEGNSHIYFSSGSTGIPKGIILKPNPVINVTKQQAKIVNFKPNSKFAWLLSPSFDASLSDIYLTLFSGGCLHICTFEQTKVKSLINYFNKHKITHSDLSPSILPFINFNNIDYLTYVIFGGEIANKNVFNKYKHINFYNAYGPTETSICSSMKKVDDNWSENNIGTPLLNVNYYIHDNELFISGEHLFDGYLDTAMTINKTITINNVLYYKTGDLVKKIGLDYYYLGRIDRQFKHNGILISPEEIESLSIKAGCIFAKCEHTDKIQLFYQGNILEEQLKNFLSQHLNKNMLPQKYIKINQFNTNINGKTIL